MAIDPEAGDELDRLVGVSDLVDAADDLLGVLCRADVALGIPGSQQADELGPPVDVETFVGFGQQAAA